MKKIIIYLILLIWVVSFVSAGNVSLNYVYNGSEWIPWLATGEGKPKIDLNLMNITAGNLIVDSYTFYVDDVNDFVGLRTESPSATLDVAGNISVPGMFFVDNESRRVGINTTSPTATLHVIGDANISGRLDVGILNISGVTFAGGNIDTSNVSANYFLGDGSLMSGLPNASLNYVYDGSDWIGMKSDSTGVLQMDISSDIADDLTCTDCIGAAEIADVYVLNTGDFVDGTLGVGGVLNATGLNVTGTDENATFMGDVQIMGTLYGGSPLKVSGGINVTSVVSGQDAFFVTDASNEKVLRITDTGELNITSSAGNTSFDSGTLFIDAENNRTGIGTSSPAEKLVVIGSVNISDSLNVSGTVQATTFIGDGSLLSGIDTSFTNNTDINVTNFVANNTLFVNGSMVGIGAANPVVELEVEGGVNISGGLNVTNGDVLLATSSGNVGIGTTTPAEKLVVIGSVNISDSLNVSGTVQATTFIGDGSSLSGIDTSFTNNTDINVTRFVANNTFFVNNSMVGIGIDSPTHKLHVVGDVNITGDIHLGQNLTDLAEYIFAEDDAGPGDAVVISDYMKVKKSYKPYDKNVIGVISTAPAAVLGGGKGDVELAIAGRVPVKVTNENGAINKGDILTTSSTPGHAMKFSLLEFKIGEPEEQRVWKMNENEQRRNSILGKALEPCYEKECKIIVLVTLQ